MQSTGSIHVKKSDIWNCMDQYQSVVSCKPTTQYRISSVIFFFLGGGGELPGDGSGNNKKYNL